MPWVDSWRAWWGRLGARRTICPHRVVRTVCSAISVAMNAFFNPSSAVVRALRALAECPVKCVVGAIGRSRESVFSLTTETVASVKLRTLVFRQFGVGSWDKGSRPWSPMGDQGQVAAVMPAVSVAPPLALHAVDPYRGSGGGPTWCPQCDAAWPPRASTHCGHRETPPPPAFGGESPA